MRENGRIAPDLHIVDLLQATNGDYRRIGGGKETRSHMPFLDPPNPPTRISELPASYQDKIQGIRDRFKDSEKEVVKDCLRGIVEPYLGMLNNIPGKKTDHMCLILLTRWRS